MKRLVPFLAVCALVVVAAPAADAGIAPGPADLVVTPNPATTTDSITIGNENNAQSTCDKGQVFYSVVKSDGEGAVAADTVAPDESGNWSVTIDAIPVAGTYVVSADCTAVDDDRLQPAALPDFVYVDAELTVTQAEVPTSSSSSTTSTVGAEAASTRPSFTG
jgi:hypothetical protein